MDIAAVPKGVIVALFTLAFLAAIILMGYSSSLGLGMAHRSEADRAAMIESERRHHRLVDRGIPLIISIMTGVFAVVIFADPAKDWVDGAIMATISVASATVFVLLIRRDRRRAGQKGRRGYRRD
ncbi:hypothetical protein [Micromonospora pallida]|uniref:hypothetical protein n=1 Tax=Micromonospora pallida TaxID=145854 RepID=UPI000B8A50B2|nr:hypothetical protein [Micromonospora pallida]